MQARGSLSVLALQAQVTLARWSALGSTMPDAQISGETQLGVWLSKVCELDAIDARQLLEVELGRAFVHANRCFCGAATQRVPSDTTALLSEQMSSTPPSRGLSSSAGYDAALPLSSSKTGAEAASCPPAGQFRGSVALSTTTTTSGSLLDFDVGDIHRISLEQALVLLLEVDAATARATLESNMSDVFQHAAICFCNGAQAAALAKESTKLSSAESSAAALQPAAAAPSVPASSVGAATKASAGAGGGKAASADAGMVGLRSGAVPAYPIDFVSAASTGASKSRSCAICACGVQ